MNKVRWYECIKTHEKFFKGDCYKRIGNKMNDNKGCSWRIDGSYCRLDNFTEIFFIAIPVLKFTCIYFILDKLHIKYNKQYKIKKLHRTIQFNSCFKIQKLIIDIYNNINLLCENELSNLHCCKIKMMFESIDMFNKMYSNKVLNNEGIKNIYNTLSKYNNFLTKENNYIENKKYDEKEKLKSKNNKSLEDILKNQNKMVNGWIKDLDDFNK